MLKQLTPFVFFILVSTIYAQNSTLQKQVTELKTQIRAENNKASKLKLLDSLTNIIHNRTDFEFDSLARITADYALKLDSFNIAARRASHLIYFYNNILGKPEEGIEVFHKYFDRVKNNISNRRLASLYIDSGDSFYYLKQVDSALAQYDKAKEYGKKAGDERAMAFAILYKGYIYSDEGDFTKASQTLQEASKIFNEVKDTFNIIATRNALAILYSANGFLAEAQEERKEAIALAEKTNSYGQVSSLYVNEATDNRKQGLEKKRISNLLKAVEANKKSKYFEQFNPMLLCELVKAYAENDSIEKARSYLRELEKKPQNTKGFYESNYYGAITKLAFAEQNYTKAQQLGIKQLEILSSSNKILEIQDAEEFLSKVYEKLNKPDLAYAHYKAYSKIKDSILSVQKTKSLAYYQILYETAKRNKKIEEQDTKIVLLDEQTKRRTLILWSLVFILIGLFTIIFLWRSRKFSRNKTHLQKVFAQDLIRNIEAERKRISSELHDSIGQNLLLIKNEVLSDSEKVKDTVLIDNTIDEVRNLSQRLHPFRFEKLGLLNSLRDTIDNFQKNSEIFYSEEIDVETLSISKDKEIFVYRMIQECLNNVEKHSQAKACIVSVEEKPDAFLFIIKDNGIGFDVSENSESLNSLGMKTLKERAQIINGSVSIVSEKGKGTTVQITVPKS